MRFTTASGLLSVLVLLASPALTSASGYTVTTNADDAADPCGATTDGQVSLREALTAISTSAACGDAPAGTATNVVTFSLPNGTIAVASTLPAITKTTSIDGAGVVVLEGSAASTAGLTLENHTGSVVRGLALRGFTGGAAISIQRNGGFVGACGGHTIAGNRIGLDDTGLVAAPNRNGVRIAECAGVTVGGTTVADRNVIGGSEFQALTILGQLGTDNVVIGNYVGVGTDGITAVPNGTGSGSSASSAYYAIAITQGAQRNRIGGSAIGERNVIAGNTVGQIHLQSGGPPFDTKDNVIRGNYLGLDATGMAIPGSGRATPGNDAAIRLEGSSGNPLRGTIVGGPNPGDGNLIAGQTGFGIWFYPSSAGSIVTTSIEGNGFGLALDGLSPRAVSRDCVRIESGTTITIRGNVLSSCQYGIGAFGVSGLDVRRNLFGFDASGNVRVPNATMDLLVMETSSGVVVGGPLASDANWFAAGTVTSMSIGQGTLENATIGLTKNGSALPAAARGGGLSLSSNLGELTTVRNVKIIGATTEGVEVGGNDTHVLLDRVEVRGSGRAGVRVVDTARVEITRSIVVSSARLAIDLDPTFGVDTNDAGDADTGPSGHQNYPEIATAELSNAGSSVSGSIGTTPSTMVRIELFATGGSPDSSGHGELASYLGSATVTTDLVGDATFAIVPSRALVPGEFVTTTATNVADGSTSEAGANFQVVDARDLDAGVDAGADGGLDAGVDAGTDAGVDAGTDVDAGGDAGSDAGTDGGVTPTKSGGCNVGGSAANEGIVLLAFVMLVALARRRRMRGV